LEKESPCYPSLYGLRYPFFHGNLKLNFPKSKLFHCRSVRLGLQESTTLLRGERKKSPDSTSNLFLLTPVTGAISVSSERLSNFEVVAGGDRPCYCDKRDSHTSRAGLIRSSRDPHTHDNDHIDDDKMGIKGLTGLISEHAPAAIQVLRFSRSRARSPRTALTTVHQEHKINTLFGRKVAIDASMSIYQFLIAVRQQDGQLLQNDAGEVTRYARIHPQLGLWGAELR
jgi:hypothetical protein